MSLSILPPNATAGERALETAMRADIDISAIGNLWNPETCPADVLPFLAWTLAISHWDTTWTEAQKRAAILGAIPFHRIKGTRAAVEEVLARFHPLLKIIEWWETNPPRPPYTFEVRADAEEITPDFLTPETAAAIIRDVAAAKPLRSHFDFIFALKVQAALFISRALTLGTIFRSDFTVIRDTSQNWLHALQTQIGEPIFDSTHSQVLEAS